MNLPTLKQLIASGRPYEAIGALQRTINFTAIANYATGQIKITAAAHGLYRLQTVYLATQAAGSEYVGTYKVLKVIDADNFVVAATFGVTRTGTLRLLASLNADGFIVSDPTGLVIAELVLETEQAQKMDAAAIIARAAAAAAGEEIVARIAKIRISGGNLLVVRAHPRSSISYTNR